MVLMLRNGVSRISALSDRVLGNGEAARLDPTPAPML